MTQVGRRNETGASRAWMYSFWVLGILKKHNYGVITSGIALHVRSQASVGCRRIASSLRAVSNVMGYRYASVGYISVNK